MAGPKAMLLKELVNRAKAGDGLAMDYASRMARAKEMGFDTSKPVYHGTATDFDAFDPDRAIGTQFWSTTDKAAIEAGEVGAQGKGVVKEMYQNIQNPAGWEEYDKFGIDELMARGYDGLALKEGGETTYVAFKPEQYRDVNAAFDPAKRSSSNLLASAAPAAVGLGALYTPEQNAAMAGQLVSSGVEDYGSITPDEFPFLQQAGDFIEKWTQTPLGSPVEGLAEYLRGFGQDDDTQAKAERAFWAALDVMP